MFIASAPDLGLASFIHSVGTLTLLILNLLLAFLLFTIHQDFELNHVNSEKKPVFLSINLVLVFVILSGFFNSILRGGFTKLLE